MIWDATDNSGHGVSAGVYLYCLIVEDSRIYKKMLLIDRHLENQNIQPNIFKNERLGKNTLVNQISNIFQLRITGENILTYEKQNININSDIVLDVTVVKPIDGPVPAYDYDEDIRGYALVKNWDFGSDGTIKNIDDLSDNFQYHDQFGTIANGTNYGAYIVAPDRNNALNNQPIEYINTDEPIREFFDSSMKTFLLPLDGAQQVHPTTKKAGCGSFQAKWTLPKGGSLLGLDLIWETRVRYVTPPYFGFAIWTAGNEWDNGAEMDVVESFGYDNGGGYTNYDGRYWHSSEVGGESETYYHSSWSNTMKKYGITNYDASEYHTWTWVYRADNTFTSYNDGRVVQRGKIFWTRGGNENGRSINMSFIFDAGWGHSQVSSVNKSLNVSEFAGKFYEWDYSRIYMR